MTCTLLWLSAENFQENNQKLTYLEFIPAMKGDGKLSYGNELISTQHSWLINILLEYVKVKKSRQEQRKDLFHLVAEVMERSKQNRD